MPCPRQCRKVALEGYEESLHLTLQIELESSFAKSRFSLAPEALTGSGGFPAGKAVRAGVKDLKVLTMPSKSRHVASFDGSPYPSRGVASAFGPGGCLDSYGPGGRPRCFDWNRECSERLCTLVTR